MDRLNARAYAPDVLTDINWLQSINIGKLYKHHRTGQLNSAHNPQTSLVTMLGLDPQEQVLRPIQYLDALSDMSALGISRPTEFRSLSQTLIFIGDKNKAWRICSPVSPNPYVILIEADKTWSHASKP